MRNSAELRAARLRAGGLGAQALALSRRLADATNQRFSVHVFSPCVGGLKSLPPPPPTSRTSLSLHGAHDAELTRLVKALGARELVNLKATLLKWEIFSLTAARVAVFVDLDLELLPHVAFLGGGAHDATLGTAAAAAAGLVAPSPRAARSSARRRRRRRGARLVGGLRLARADRVRGQRLGAAHLSRLVARQRRSC